MKPYAVLINEYIPPFWKAYKVGKDLTTITTDYYGLKPLKDPIHGPQTFRAWCSEELHAECGWVNYEGGPGEDWHQDGDMKQGARMDSALVVWASCQPTQICIKGSEEVYQPKPFQVVILNNLLCLHRRPSMCPPVRWFFRQRVEIPEWLK